MTLALPNPTIRRLRLTRERNTSALTDARATETMPYVGQHRPEELKRRVGGLAAAYPTLPGANLALEVLDNLGRPFLTTFVADRDTRQAIGLLTCWTNDANASVLLALYDYNSGSTQTERDRIMPDTELALLDSTDALGINRIPAIVD